MEFIKTKSILWGHYTSRVTLKKVRMDLIFMNSNYSKIFASYNFESSKLQDLLQS
jgi:hypothetical protein